MIFKASNTIEFLGSYSKIKQNNVRNIPQHNETIIDFSDLEFDLKISIIVDEDSEFIEELNEDIAADKTPANINPFKPVGI